ncbi:hypothetical protein FIV31_07800 [Coxiella endosymbiont of Ornithodoros amblus]|uniref:hypothetical protein n=1 Tax=Coxiella endosymbiont of Ornithodoros amblus TaxID=1656166 RepID=UPI00244E1DAE|nr:hypothetical protein [Coxiella endosymbiont of Ornithodoros amblus]MBW5803114.1 hypothetical protein [Coxiella endosymbiont of Ornithodoros amblus]
MTYLAIFPLDNAYNIRQILLAGQLEVISGYYQYQYFIIQTSDKEYRFKTLFNAIGPSYDPTAFPLYRRY